MFFSLFLFFFLFFLVHQIVSDIVDRILDVDNDNMGITKGDLSQISTCYWTQLQAFYGKRRN